MRINHNIPSLRALHQLDKSNSKLDGTLERLSSGLRINHAADDAAGLAITQKMDTQVRGLKQANRNAMDGISLIQTAEGALTEVHSMLQRVRELAVQVSNGTYDAQDRKAVQDEVTQLQNEIERISSSIEFNEMKLLNGDVDRRAFSTNADIADIVSMSDTVGAGDFEFEVSQLASKTTDTGGNVSLFDSDGEATVTGQININGEQIDITIGDTSEAVFSELRDLCSRVDASITVEPGSPFENGKQLNLELNQYGPKDLDVTGSLVILEALGLDSANFQPNTSNAYMATSDDYSGGLGSADGSVIINNIEVAFSNLDDTATILGKLRAASIPGAEFALDSTGNSIVSITGKPMAIAAKTAADAALAAELESITGAGTGTLTVLGGSKTVASRSESNNILTTGAPIALTAGEDVTFQVQVDGVNTGTTFTYAGGTNFDMSVSANVDTFIGELNGAVTGTTTTFAYEDGRVVGYNEDGDNVTLNITQLLTENELTDIQAAVGLSSATVSYTDFTSQTSKSVTENPIDTSLAVGGNVQIYVDGKASAVPITLSDPFSGMDVVVQELNAGAPTGVIFALSEDETMIVAYSEFGFSVTIEPENNSLVADRNIADALGFRNGDTVQETGFGNRGRNVQIDTSAITGFPMGTTVSTDGENITFASNDSFELRLVSGATTGAVTMNLLETGPLDLQIGANEGQFMEIRIQNLSPRALGITDINLSTSEGAQEAIGIIDTAIETISTVRSKLGAYQNRLEHTIANLESASENMTASLSRILDADMAYEMSQFTQQNVIQQAGTSMLAQANQRPQSLLQLLQG